MSLSGLVHQSSWGMQAVRPRSYLLAVTVPLSVVLGVDALMGGSYGGVHESLKRTCISIERHGLVLGVGTCTHLVSWCE
jgi:hypothetical protein